MERCATQKTGYLGILILFYLHLLSLYLLGYHFTVGFFVGNRLIKTIFYYMPSFFITSSRSKSAIPTWRYSFDFSYERCNYNLGLCFFSFSFTYINFLRVYYERIFDHIPTLPVCMSFWKKLSMIYIHQKE